ncbi:MAG: single-stranded-DNA-specific exonuclease RecJ, partial [Dehalococcoidales bacterium]
MNHSRWHLLPPIPDQRLANHPDFPPLIIQLLYNRGLTEPSQWQSFIAGDESQFNDPFLLPGIAQAVTRIYRALLSGE